jgi:hypothetical protein
MTTILNAIEIKAENYMASYDPETSKVSLSGALRLAGMEEYAPISQLMIDVLNSGTDQLTIDLQRLDFLNSSGINMLSKFVITARQRPDTKVLVLGSVSIPWQGKSLKNLQRLMPTLQLQLA